jgi:vacuolar-type H+-ATPase subunit I/STV1
VDTVILLLRDPPLMVVLGVVTLCAGLAMVLAHNAWSGGALAVIVTLVGWATLIKGLLFLILTPDAETALFLKALHYQEWFRLYAAISLAVGVYLTHGGFKKSSRL